MPTPEADFVWKDVGVIAMVLVFGGLGYLRDFAKIERTIAGRRLTVGHIRSAISSQLCICSPPLLQLRRGHGPFDGVAANVVPVEEEMKGPPILTAIWGTPWDGGRRGTASFAREDGCPR